MAAKARAKKASGGVNWGELIVGGLKISAMLLVGVVAGYLWRSYYPLPLPMESALVSDRSSNEVAIDQLKELARAANQKAEQTEAERLRLAKRLEELQADRHKTERDLAELQIKSVLRESTEN